MKQIFFTIILALSFYIPAYPQNENSLCPKIEVVGGGVVQAGEAMNFSVKINDETKTTNLEYEWKVSLGTIANGQGTDSIVVDTTGLSGQNIKAEVKVKGLSANCANFASEIGSVLQKLPLEILDEFGKLTNNEVIARVDALFVRLGNDPNLQGYIINYGTDKEVSARERQIQKAIAFRKYDLSRVTIVRGGANPSGRRVLTKVLNIFKNGELPLP